MYGIKNTMFIKLIIFALTIVGCIICIIMGVRSNKRAEERIAACTSSAAGVISDVKEYRDDDDTEYVYTVDFTDAEGKNYRFSTRRTSSKHKKGETTTIHYDPSDMTSVYADLAPPPGGTTFYIAAGCLPIAGLINLFSRRRRI